MSVFAQIPRGLCTKQASFGCYCLSSKNNSSKIPMHFLGDARLTNVVWDSSCLMEQRAVVRFFPLKTRSAKDISSELKHVHGHEVLSPSAVKKWCNRFVKRRIDLEDDTRSRGPSQSDLCESVQALIQDSPFITCKGIC
jgi:hypothetical protein